MAKKPQQQTETNSHALSREDRKNEQIMRMIERAEKQRLKKEQKKKLQVSLVVFTPEWSHASAETAS